MSDPKHFWTTLPGIMTGVASLITALVGLFAFLHKSPPAPPQSAQVAFMPIPVPQGGASLQAVKPQGCEKAVGNWDWFLGGVVTIEKDGHIVWRRNAQDLFPSAVGVWNCIDTNAQELTLTWQATGMTDTMILSADGNQSQGQITPEPR